MKYGSLQMFVESSDVAGDLSADLFDTEQVHRIAMLDLRICNLDRNDANILVRKERSKTQTKYYLIPVDHGMSIPDNLEI